VTAAARHQIAGSLAVLIHVTVIGALAAWTGWMGRIPYAPLGGAFEVEISSMKGGVPGMRRGRPAGSSVRSVSELLASSVSGSAPGSAPRLETAGNQGDAGGKGGSHGGEGSAVPTALLVGNQTPPYPSLSRRLGEEGQVLVTVRILSDGRAEEVALKSSSGFERLDAAALAFARSARYEPGVAGNGRELKVLFSLQ